MVNTETIFLKRVRSALRRKPAKPHAFRDIFGNPEMATRRHANLSGIQDADEQADLLEILMAEGRRVNLNVRIFADILKTAEAITHLILQQESEQDGSKSVVAWDHPLLRQLALESLLTPAGIPVHHAPLNLTPNSNRQDASTAAPLKTRFRKQTAQALFGITSADYCIAETATLVMKTRPGQARAVSLLPPVHIAVIHKDQVIPDLGTLYTHLDSDTHAEGLTNCLTFITGPSRTRDIEGVMVFGAHGPREVHLFVIDGAVSSSHLIR